MLATCRFKGAAIIRGLGGRIMRTAAVSRRCASDSAAHGTGLAAVLLAVVVYAVMVVALRILTRDDLSLMPKGDKIARLLHIN